MPRPIRSLVLFCIVATTVTLLAPMVARADWVQNGVPAIPDPENNTGIQVIDDGAGGVIAVFQYSSSLDDIYAQRWDPRGNRVWGASGVALCSVAGYQNFPALTGDGAGGAIVAWEDQRNGPADVYAQRVDANGNVLWTPGGVRVTFENAQQSQVKLTTDGFGGAILTWRDARSGGYDIYAQRLRPDGSNVWLLGGVSVSTAFSSQYSPDLIPDDAGGAIIVWTDFRSGLADDIYAHRINNLGATLWAVDGEPVVTAAEDQQLPAIAPDGAGGVIVAWEDWRNFDYDIYAQRLDASGNALWYPQGTFVSAVAGAQRQVDIVSDGAGGCILAWQDLRGADNDIYAGRVTATGLSLWELDGRLICDATGNQTSVELAMDGEGGAVMFWTDNRPSNGSDIYAQRVEASGQALWTNDGVPVSSAAGAQYTPLPVATTDGGFISVFNDQGSGTILAYAQRVGRRYGEWGNPEPVISSVADVPADQGGVVNVNWLASGRDNLNEQLIGNYSVWRAVDAASFLAATSGDGAPGKVVDPAVGRVAFDRDTYTVQHTAAGTYFWQWVGDQVATYSPAYSYAAATQHDSVSTDPGVHYFRVIAHHAWDQFRFWESNPDSGYSVDNVAPGSPLALAAMRAGGSDVDLDWSPAGAGDPDFLEYRVYRGGTAGFPIDPGHFLLSTPDTMAVDTGADPANPYYYKVVAVDVHENQSDGSNEAMVDAVPTGIGDTPALRTLQVTSFPNPFTRVTEISVGLPAPADVTLNVFDVAGRRVFERRLPAADAGWHSIRFDGRTSTGGTLPSGVYFARVTAGVQTQTRKLVISR